jgi:hypothetical protein
VVLGILFQGVFEEIKIAEYIGFCGVREVPLAFLLW